MLINEVKKQILLIFMIIHLRFAASYLPHLRIFQQTPIKNSRLPNNFLTFVVF